MLTGDEQQRDVAAQAVKTVTTSANLESAERISLRLMSQLVLALQKSNPDAVVLEILDITATLLRRFGKKLVSHHTALQEVLMPFLEHTRPAIRKRAIEALSTLVGVAADEPFNALCSTIIESMSVASRTMTGEDASSQNQSTMTKVQLVSAVCSVVGVRIAAYIDALVPLIEDAASFEENDELREACVQAFETIAARCPIQFASVPFFCISIAAFDFVCR